MKAVGRIDGRTVRIALTPEMLQELLDLPEDAGVVAVQADMDPVRIEVLIQSPHFPEKANPEMSSPILMPYVDVTEEDIEADPELGIEEHTIYHKKYSWNWPERNTDDQE